MKFDSPTGRKLKKKRKSVAGSAEPTMTFHTRAATDEIYSIFNQPLQSELQARDDGESFCGSDYEDDDDTTASVGETTGRLSATASEFGDDDNGDVTGRNYDEATERAFQDETHGDITGVSEWSEFTGKHIPGFGPPEANENYVSESYHGVSESGCRPDDCDNDMQNNSPLSSDHSKDNSSRNKFVPLPPPDYDPPVGPYRDATVVAQNRLPFMTPIVEQTESSLGYSTMLKEKGYHYYKTPSKMTSTPAIPEMDDTVFGSPYQDLTLSPDSRFCYPIEEGSPSRSAKKLLASPPKSPFALKLVASAPRVIIQEQLCNPMDPNLRENILKNIAPPLRAYPGYFDHGSRMGGTAMDIRRYFRANGKGAKKNGTEEMVIPPMLSFEGALRDFEVKRELGEGGYAPVYLAESIDSPDSFSSDSEQEPNAQKRGLLMGRRASRDIERKSLEAIKIENAPPSAWEFYMLRISCARLSSSAYQRVMDNIVQAHELHMFKDESVLVEDFQSQGTLIDLINIARNEQNGNSGDPGLDEAVAMFFAIELFRTIEALHTCGIVHGDLKGDNCLVRLGESSVPHMNEDPAMAAGGVHYSPTGAYGWRNKGLTLIDFGRAIDMQVFRPSVQFVADWKIGSHECTEMKECRPWTYQVDMYGLASTVFMMLFGKYMEVIPVDNGSDGAALDINGGPGKTYRIKEYLKRYWEREIWSEVFDLCLNPTSAKWVEIEQRNSARSSPASGFGSGSTSRFGSPASDSDAENMDRKAHLPVVNSMRVVREMMEDWLVENAGRKGLQGQLNKLEALVAKKRGKRGSSEKF